MENSLTASPDNASTDTGAAPSLTPDTRASESAASSRPAASRKKSAPASATSTPERVGQSYRLTSGHDWALRYACLMLEQEDGQRRSNQDLIDQAVLELLQRFRKKGMEFPANVLP